MKSYREYREEEKRHLRNKLYEARNTIEVCNRAIASYEEAKYEALHECLSIRRELGE